MEFRVGQPVAVTRLEDADKTCTDLKIGEIGIVRAVENPELVSVDFFRNPCTTTNLNFRRERGYYMYNYQLRPAFVNSNKERANYLFNGE